MLSPSDQQRGHLTLCFSALGRPGMCTRGPAHDLSNWQNVPDLASVTFAKKSKALWPAPTSTGARCAPLGLPTGMAQNILSSSASVQELGEPLEALGVAHA